MRSKRKLKPGEPGTQKFLQRYGDDLVCVRYRYDATTERRVTTVELIVESGPVQKLTFRIRLIGLACVRTDRRPATYELFADDPSFVAAWNTQRQRVHRNPILRASGQRSAFGQSCLCVSAFLRFCASWNRHVIEDRPDHIL